MHLLDCGEVTAPDWCFTPEVDACSITAEPSPSPTTLRSDWPREGGPELGGFKASSAILIISSACIITRSMGWTFAPLSSTSIASSSPWLGWGEEELVFCAVAEFSCEVSCCPEAGVEVSILLGGLGSVGKCSVLADDVDGVGRVGRVPVISSEPEEVDTSETADACAPEVDGELELAASLFWAVSLLEWID